MFVRKGKTTYKTADYNRYQNDIRDELMGVEWPFGEDKVVVAAIAGLSSKAADLDNVIKPLLDTLQNVFEPFNDKNVTQINLFREDVKKGEEFIELVIIESKLNED